MRTYGICHTTHDRVRPEAIEDNMLVIAVEKALKLVMLPLQEA